MGEVISMWQARVRKAKERADAKVKKEEEKNQRQHRGSSLQQALDKFGSFTGNQLKKKKEKKDGDV